MSRSTWRANLRDVQSMALFFARMYVTVCSAPFYAPYNYYATFTNLQESLAGDRFDDKHVAARADDFGDIFSLLR